MAFACRTRASASSCARQLAISAFLAIAASTAACLTFASAASFARNSALMALLAAVASAEISHVASSNRVTKATYGPQSGDRRPMTAEMLHRTGRPLAS